MFGLPLYSELIQGSALRTWDCVAWIAAFLWGKFSNINQPNMPRSRRRHHSRSRSRSRSHSHERDREPKRRKIESFESPHHRRSVSSEPEAKVEPEQNIEDNMAQKISDDSTNKDTGINNKKDENIICDNDKENIDDNIENENSIDPCIVKEVQPHAEPANIKNTKDDNTSGSNSADNSESDQLSIDDDNKESEPCDETNLHSDSNNITDSNKSLMEVDEVNDSENKGNSSSYVTPTKQKITPKKPLTAKQIQKRLESEKKRQERQKERDEREKQRQMEKDEKLKEKEKKRQEKEDQKQKEKEQKLKEKEQKDKEKEMKKKEKEEKESEKEQKRLEKIQEKLKKQQEIDEKNKEKQKMEEQKQKAAAAFVNFFVPKKTDHVEEKKRDDIGMNFMPFEVKSDMRLAPICRHVLSEDDKNYLLDLMQKQNSKYSFLSELKEGKTIRRSPKTWPYDDNSDDLILVEELGESIVEQNSKMERMKAKFLKFHENHRPAYFGTWRKNSRHIKPRKPFGRDSDVLNYEVDSDDEWEEEVDGESIVGSDEEEKEESENDNDYEVDNEYFVPHGYLSEDEVDDEEEQISPEAQKANLKLLKNQFDEERKSKIERIKPRLIGCIWYNKGNKVDEAIDRYLQPLSIITAGPIHIGNRSDPLSQITRAKAKGLDKELIPDFIKLIHGNVHKKRWLANEYLEYLNKNNIDAIVTKSMLSKEVNNLAQYIKCPDEGPMFNKLCWYVSDEVRREFNVDPKLPNKWTYTSTITK